MSEVSAQSVIKGLSREYGIALSDIAARAHVSLAELRQLRAGAAVSTEQLRSLQELRALMNLLREQGVEDPAGWYTKPLLDGYVLAPVDIERLVTAGEMLAFARGELELETLLDAHLPGWREQYHRAYHVVRDAAGNGAIVRL